MIELINKPAEEWTDEDREQYRQGVAHTIETFVDAMWPVVDAAVQAWAQLARGAGRAMEELATGAFASP